MHREHTIDASRERSLRAACADLDSRLRAGEAARAEDYLPTLLSTDTDLNVDAALELIYTEYSARESRGEAVPRESWFERFPHLRDQLDRLLEIHELLGSEPEQDPYDTRRGVPSGPSEPHLTSNRTGYWIGQYWLVEEIGRGGMGVVFRARQRGLDRDVAIKMLLAQHATWQMQARFRKEAETVARLRHPHIVQIFEVGEQDGCTYLSMEFVDGAGLDQELIRSPLGAMRAAELIEKLARAMDYAHGLGIIHRDLKPSNVLLTRQGDPKITDFGLVKLLTPGIAADRDPASGAATPRDLTMTGQILGTPSYMAPEQTSGKNSSVGPLADVYALGAILYEALCGRPPFRGETPLDTLDQVRSQEPVPPGRLQPKLPRDLETICLKCLAKDPHTRYATAGLLADDLQRFVAGKPIFARPVSGWERAAKWSRRHPAAAALIAVAVLGFAGVAWQWANAESIRARAVEAASEADTARRAEQSERQRVERLLYAHQISRAYHEYLTHNVPQAHQLLGGTRVDLRNWEWRYLNQLFRPELQTLGNQIGRVSAIVFSPDGKRVASMVRGAIAPYPSEAKVWDVESGAERFHLTGLAGWEVGLAFSPDGKRLVTTGLQPLGVGVWDSTTGASLQRIVTRGVVFSVAFSPDGRWLALGYADGKIGIHDGTSGAEALVIPGHKHHVLELCFSPDGNLLASAGRDGVASLWNPDTGHNVHSVGGLADVRAVAFRPDGQQLAIGTYPGLVKILELTADGVRDGPTHPRSSAIGRLLWSPDGTQLAVITGFEGLQIWNSETFHLERTLYGRFTAVAFGPDGRQLATGDTDGVVRLWDWTSPETQPAENRVLPFQHIASDLALSADSRSLAVASNHDNVLRVFDSSTRRLIRNLRGHERPITAVDFSHDSRLIATCSSDKTVRLWDSASGQTLHTLAGHSETATGVAFHRDGARVVSAGTDGTIRLWDVKTGQLLHTSTQVATRRLRVARQADGRTVAAACDDHTIRIWDSNTGESLREWRAHKSRITDLAFDPDGTLLASCASDGLIHLWDVAAMIQGPNEQPPRILRGHQGDVATICFSADGARLASTGFDWSLKIWDTTAAQEVLSIRKFLTRESRVRFSPDGSTVWAIANGLLYAWRVAEQTAQSADLAEAPLQVTDWHVERASELEKTQHWWGARFHWSQVLELDPGDWRHWGRRGYAHLRLREWDRAAADFDRAAVPGADIRVLSRRAIAHLANQDGSGYRTACSDLLAAFRESTSAERANTASWTCLLSPSAGVDPEQLVHIAEQAVASERSYATLNTLGAALYRAGRFADAVAALDEAIAADGHGGNVYDWLFLAMSHHGLGHPQEAKSWLEKSVEWIDKAFQVQSSLTWRQEVELPLLRREAEQLLGTPPPDA